MSDDSNNLIDLLFMLLAKKVIKLSPQREEGTLGSSCFLLFREESVVPAFPRAFHKLLSLSSGLGGEPFVLETFPLFLEFANQGVNVLGYLLFSHRGLTLWTVGHTKAAAPSAREITITAHLHEPEAPRANIWAV